jgi:hypothetical protein
MKEMAISAGFLLVLFFDPEDGGEMSVVFQRTARSYIPEDGTLHNHRCENFRFYGGIILLPVKVPVIFESISG